jgi:hypothetical protein
MVTSPAALYLDPTLMEIVETFDICLVAYVLHIRLAPSLLSYLLGMTVRSLQSFS